MRVADERALAVRELTGLPLEVPWRVYGLFPQVVFFVLACCAVVAACALFGGIVTGVLALALAEVLIRRYRWGRTGVEAALWLGGLFALISELPHSGQPEALLVMAAAAAVAGARVRNPLFGALAAGLVMYYFEKRWDLGVLFALIAAAIAIALVCRSWQRPSTEWLFILIAVAMPLAGYGEADAKWRTVTIVLYAAFGVLALLAAIARPHHAFFLAAAEGFAVAAFELAREIAAPLEAKLAIGGAFLLALSLLVSRALRGRTRGFVTTKERLTNAGDLLEIAGAISISSPEQPATRESGGGQFGGAGASGTF
jgi:hypothetical protein